MMQFGKGRRLLDRCRGRRSSELPENIGRRERHARIDDHCVHLRQTRDGRDVLAYAPHERRPVTQAHRHVGAEFGRDVAPGHVRGVAWIGLPDGAQQGCRIGRAAAETGGHGQILLETDRTQAEPRLGIPA